MNKLLATLLVTAMLVAGCSDDGDNSEDDTTTSTTEATTTAPVTTSPTTTSTSTTTTTTTPAPVASGTPLEVCQYLTGVDDAQDEGEVAWVTVTTPPDADQPLVVLGFNLDGARNTEQEIDTDQRAFVAAAVPFGVQLLAARPDVTSFVVVSSGGSFELSNKTLWQFARADLEAVSDPEAFVASAESADWTGGRLPLTYLGPNPARLDANGSFIDSGSACDGL